MAQAVVPTVAVKPAPRDSHAEARAFARAITDNPTPMTRPSRRPARAHRGASCRGDRYARVRRDPRSSGSREARARTTTSSSSSSRRVRSTGAGSWSCGAMRGRRFREPRPREGVRRHPRGRRAAASARPRRAGSRGTSCDEQSTRIPRLGRGRGDWTARRRLPEARDRARAPPGRVRDRARAHSRDHAGDAPHALPCGARRPRRRATRGRRPLASCAGCSTRSSSPARRSSSRSAGSARTPPTSTRSRSSTATFAPGTSWSRPKGLAGPRLGVRALGRAGRGPRLDVRSRLALRPAALAAGGSRHVRRSTKSTSARAGESSPRASRYWEIMGNVRWAAASLHQGERYMSGGDSDIELVGVARRAIEMEYEALRLIDRGAADARAAEQARSVDRASRVSSRRSAPAPTDPRLAFRALIAAHLARVVATEPGDRRRAIHARARARSCPCSPIGRRRRVSRGAAHARAPS